MPRSLEMPEFRPKGAAPGRRDPRVESISGAFHSTFITRPVDPAKAERAGRGCCGLPAPTDSAGRSGICVCEFEDRFGMGQSKVSYHLKKLKDSGLVREEKRGKWNYYSVDAERAETLISASRELLLG